MFDGWFYTLKCQESYQVACHPHQVNLINWVKASNSFMSLSLPMEQVVRGALWEID